MASRVDEESIATDENEQQEAVVVEAAGNGYSYGSFPDNDLASVAKPTAHAPPSSARALAPDLLRGLLMTFMAMDHNVVSLHVWEHGTGLGNENDSFVVTKWNIALGYFFRTLAHLCAPGFTFLLGMGIVYFGRSRARLGWSRAQMARHFAIRGLVLVLVTMLMGLTVTGGQIWLMNIVLAELGVDYFVVGVLWLGMTVTEPALTQALSRWFPDDQPEEVVQPLLRSRTGDPSPVVRDQKQSARAEAISWHIHNIALLALSFITIWWNIWLSPTHGHCEMATQKAELFSQEGGLPDTTASDLWRWLFFTVESTRIVSVFPPFAWLSFAILGLLYGRLILHRPWSIREMTSGNVMAGLAFSVLFIMTRVLRIGNLSENCLQTPAHIAHPDTNPYLLDVPSFFYIVKYPPDVAFFAFTLAVTFFLLALLGAIPPRFATRWLKVLLTFGTSALFFYIVHIYVVFGINTMIAEFWGHETGEKDPMTGMPVKKVDSILLLFGIWFLVMGIMYPLCKWYSSFKKTRGVDSVWRFF